MTWLSQNWLWILLGLGALLLMRRTGCFGGMGHGQHGHGGGDHGGHSGHSSDDPSSPPMQTAVATDPVTGKEVPTARAATSVYRGRIYYFETPQSRQRFEASPEQYARDAVGHSTSSAEAPNRPHKRRHGGC